MTTLLHTEFITPTQRAAMEAHRRLERHIASHAPGNAEAAKQPSQIALSVRARPAPPPAPIVPQFGMPIDPEMSFASFLRNDSNALVATAATRTTKHPGNISPLVIYGGPGFGKSHLLQAIGNASESAAWYISGDWFNSHIIERRALIDSRDRAILIDDLQQVTGKAAREDFLALMRSMQRRRQQLVVSIDRMPSELDIGAAINSRLTGGLILQVPAPDADLRFGLIKAAFERIELPVNDECLNYLAHHIRTGARALQGVVNRLSAQASLLDAPVDMAMVTAAVAELALNQEPRRITVRDIQQGVARGYGVNMCDLLSSRRTANVVMPRQVAMYLAKVMTGRSLPDIGRRFGGRDHTTVLHGVRKIEHLIGKDSKLNDEVEFLKRQISEGTAP